MRLNLKKIGSLVSGQSMVEVVIALGVVVVLALSLVSASLVTQKTSRSARNDSQATKYAEQIAERLRVLRDRSGYNAVGSGLTSTYSCWNLNIPNTNNPNGPNPWNLSANSSCTTTAIDSTFSQKIELAILDVTKPYVKNVRITISWTENGQSRNIVHSTNLSGWCGGQIVAGGTCPAP